MGVCVHMNTRWSQSGSSRLAAAHPALACTGPLPGDRCACALSAWTSVNAAGECGLLVHAQWLQTGVPKHAPSRPIGAGLAEGRNHTAKSRRCTRPPEDQGGQPGAHAVPLGDGLQCGRYAWRPCPTLLLTILALCLEAASDAAAHDSGVCCRRRRRMSGAPGGTCSHRPATPSSMRSSSSLTA